MPRNMLYTFSTSTSEKLVISSDTKVSEGISEIHALKNLRDKGDERSLELLK